MKDKKQKNEEQLKKDIDRFKFNLYEPEVDFPISYVNPEKKEENRQKVFKRLKKFKQPKIK